MGAPFRSFETALQTWSDLGKILAAHREIGHWTQKRKRIKALTATNLLRSSPIRATSLPPFDDFSFGSPRTSRYVTVICKGNAAGNAERFSTQNGPIFQITLPTNLCYADFLSKHLNNSGLRFKGGSLFSSGLLSRTFRSLISSSRLVFAIEPIDFHAYEEGALLLGNKTKRRRLCRPSTSWDVPLTILFTAFPS